jgi:hypothetical protein
VSWNYRVIRREPAHVDSEPTFSIHEVFYTEAGVVDGWTSDPVWPMGETADELREELWRMLGATTKPIMVESEDDTRLEELP